MKASSPYNYFPYFTLATRFRYYLVDAAQWALFLLTLALHMFADFLPNLAIILLSNWDEALLLHDMAALWQLVPFVVGFYLSSVLLTALANLCGYALTILMSSAFTKDSTQRVVSPRYLDQLVAKKTSEYLHAPLSQVIFRDPQRYFSAAPRFFTQILSALFLSTWACYRLYMYGLSTMLTATLAVGLVFTGAAFWFTQSWSRYFSHKNSMLVNSSDVFNELKQHKNAATHPNTVAMYKHKLQTILAKVNATDGRIMWLTFVNDICQGVLDMVCKPVFSLLAFYTLCLLQGPAMTYAGMRELARVLVSVFAAFATLVKNRASMAEMQTSADNMEALNKEYPPLSPQNLSTRVAQNGLYAEGVLKEQQDGSVFYQCVTRFSEDGGVHRDYQNHNKGAYIQPGKRCALVGMNGAGKTTLMKVLAKQIPMVTEKCAANHLKVVSYSQEVDSLSNLFESAPGLLALICYYWPVEHDLFKSITLGEADVLQKRLPLGQPGKDCVVATIIDQIKSYCQKMNLSGLGALSYSEMQQLSGGQKQLLYASVCLAVADCAEAKLLLLDEVRNFMDPEWLSHFEKVLSTRLQENSPSYGVVEICHPNSESHLKKMDAIWCMSGNKLWVYNSFSDFNDQVRQGKIAKWVDLQEGNILHFNSLPNHKKMLS